MSGKHGETVSLSLCVSGTHGETVSLSPCVSGKPSFALDIGTKNSIIRLKMKENINGNERKAVVPSGTYCIEFIVFCFALRLYKFYNDKKIIQGGQQQHVLSFVDCLALVFGCHEPESVEPKLSF